MMHPTVLADIAAERERQAVKWNRPHEFGYGDCSSSQVEPMVKLAVLGEEFGEVARALLEPDTHGPRELYDELCQVAAVAVAWMESL